MTPFLISCDQLWDTAFWVFPNSQGSWHMFFVPCLYLFFCFLFHVYGVYIPFHVCSKGSSAVDPSGQRRSRDRRAPDKRWRGQDLQGVLAVWAQARPVAYGTACPRAVRTRWAHTLRSLTAAGTADPACARERLGGCRPYNSASTSICATSWASERARAPSSSTMARSSGSKCSPLCPSPCESETACPHPERRRLLRVVPGGSRLTPGVLQVSGGSHGHLLSTNGGKS